MKETAGEVSSMRSACAYGRAPNDAHSAMRLAYTRLVLGWGSEAAGCSMTGLVGLNLNEATYLFTLDKGRNITTSAALCALQDSFEAHQFTAKSLTTAHHEYARLVD